MLVEGISGKGDFIAHAAANQVADRFANRFADNAIVTFQLNDGAQGIRRVKTVGTAQRRIRDRNRMNPQLRDLHSKAEIECDAQGMSFRAAKMDIAEAKIPLPSWAVGAEVAIFQTQPHVIVELATQPCESLVGKHSVRITPAYGRASQRDPVG